MDLKIKNLEKDFLDKINSSTTLKELDEIFLLVFGKNGKLTLLPKEFLSLPKDDLTKVGSLFNKTKKKLEQEINNKRSKIREESYLKLDQEELDLNKEVEIKKRQGHLHPLSQFEKEITEIFAELGFQRFDAPLIDSDFNNFEVLNIPEEHPARDLWDTLYIASGKDSQDGSKLLLRTHTSNSQIHVMKSLKLPIRVMNIGNCFRYENLDARHEHTFYQFELVYIDRNLSMANLQYLSEFFFKKIYGENIRVRLRPKYYPFTEPSAGIDAECVFCKGKGCRVCGTGWLELAGAGMIHPKVLENGGIDPKVYSGIAWGLGPERMLMLKDNIEDIRLFRSGDLRFLEKF